MYIQKSMTEFDVTGININIPLVKDIPTTDP
jgi:hypothetical protein